jgi:amino acid permease
MDGLANIGSALATPQMVIAMILGSLLILIAIVMMSNKSMSVGHGLATIGAGAVIIFFAWLNRKLVRSSKGYATYMGARDLFSILR